MVNKNVWEVIWDYDPNGLIVIDEMYEIQLINPAFVKYFHPVNWYASCALQGAGRDG